MTFTALVMAATRRGPDEPVARLKGVRQKCLAPVAGVPMLTRVIRSLRASPEIGRIYVSIENAELLAGVPDSHLAQFIPSSPSLTESAVNAVAAMPHDPWPLIITTADNALHTPEMVGFFCAQSRAAGADVTVGMTPAATILAKYPSGFRAFHRFKDGAASSCNIYGLMNARALAAAQAFAGGGQFGKRPWRVLQAFGFGTFALHLLHRLTLEAAMARIGRGFDLNVRAIGMPYAEAAIDIDSLEDLALAEKILRDFPIVTPVERSENRGPG